jgi:hypothetical protein
MTVSNQDDWVVERWRVDPRWTALELDEPPAFDATDRAPALWKDLTLASITAILLWIAAVALVG